MHGRIPRRTLAPLLAAIGAAAASAPAAPAGAGADGAATNPPVSLAHTSNELCREGQRRTAGVSLPISNIVHPQYDSFVKSKPAVQPLETQQYVEYASDDRSRPLRVSCKFKSADHIRAVYGAGAANQGDDPNACRELNRAIVLAVYRDLTPLERSRVVVPPQRFMLDGDDVQIRGSAWTAPFQYVYAGSDGSVHLRSKSLLVLWDDWRWKIAPDRFRGTHYCHLTAPEHVRELMLGRARAPAAAAQD